MQIIIECFNLSIHFFVGGAVAATASGGGAASTEAAKEEKKEEEPEEEEESDDDMGFGLFDQYFFFAHFFCGNTFAKKEIAYMQTEMSMEVFYVGFKITMFYMAIAGVFTEHCRSC